jgi:hypothetical protein
MINGKTDLEDVRELIEKEIGPFHVVKQVSDGLNSEVSAIVRTDDDITFIKGRKAGHPWAWTQERERAINPAVRHISPCLKWSVRNDTWDLNGFEYVPGRHADYSHGSADIPKVVSALQQLQEIPCPDVELKQADQRWASYTDTPELFTGTCLLHTEWTPGNVLVSRRAYLVDWAWPTRGAAWIDPACWIVWLIASGHTPRSAEQCAALIPSWQDAPARSLDEFARVQARMWAGIAAESSEPWTKSLAAASSLWSSHRDILITILGNLHDW